MILWTVLKEITAFIDRFMVGLRLPLAFFLGLLLWSSALSAKDLEFRDVAANFDSSKTLKLGGAWDFYWKVFLLPEQADRTPDYRADGNSSSGWNNILDTENKPLGPVGYATYRMELRNLPLSKDGYELHFPYIYTASRIILFNRADPNQRVEARTGVLGDSVNHMVPQFSDAVLKFQPATAGESWIVLVQVSNFYHSKGGFVVAPKLATGTQISERLYKDQIGYVFSLGVILVISGYNLMLFYRRREDTSSLTLALFCLTAALRAFANGKLVNHFFEPDSSLPYLIRYSLEYSTLCLEPFAYVAFVHFSFREASWPRFLPVFAVFATVGTVLTFFSWPLVYARYLPVYQVFIGVQSIFTLVVLFRAFVRNFEGARLALGSALVLVFAIVYDILVSYNILPQPYIMQYGIDVFVFLQSQVVATRFAIAFRTVERLQRDLKIEVEKQTQEIRSMMEHVPQGIFLVERDMTIQGNYSKYLEEILGHRSLAGSSISSILWEGKSISCDQKSIIDSVMISCFGEVLITWEFNSDQMPHELVFVQPSGDKRTLEIDWHPIVGTSDLVERLLVTIRDVTSVRVLQAENRHKQIELDRLMELLSAEPGTLNRFFEHANIHLERSRNVFHSTESLDHIRRMVFIELHSLKGLIRAQGLRSFAGQVHEVEQSCISEQRFDRAGAQDNVKKIKECLDEYQQLYQKKFNQEAQQKSEPCLEKQDLAFLESKLQPVRALGQINQPTLDLVHAVQEFLSVYFYRSAGKILNELLPAVQKLAQDLGKEPPKITLIGVDSLRLVPQAELLMRNSFLHSIRNSLDHGLETKAERIAKGKDPQGHIVITCQDRNQRLEITYEDDGRGLDVARIENRARAKGLWNSPQAMTVADAGEMLFHSGFSTKTQVSEISGRGVGLDAVRTAYREVGGEVMFKLDGIEGDDRANIPFRLWGWLPKKFGRR